MQKRWPLALMATAMAAVAACSDSSNSSGSGTPGSELTFLRLAPTAPTLCNDSTGAWFVKDPNGQDQEIALEFPETAGGCLAGNTEDFLRLKLKPTSLLRRPDNTLISNGDSIFIYVRWVGNDSILFDLQPSGLLFDLANPAELKIEYGEAGEDLDGDGNVDGEDHVVETKLDIWRQEHPGDPFFRVGTAKSEEFNEIEAKLNGFSRFALAY